VLFLQGKRSLTSIQNKVPVLKWEPRHEDVLWSGDICPRSLDVGASGGEWSASRPGRFAPRERAAGSPWIGCWVDSRAGLDATVKREIHSPCQESNPRTPIVQAVA
jgi:hypothetical protein